MAPQTDTLSTDKADLTKQVWDKEPDALACACRLTCLLVLG